jgi:hypothetical protein
VRAARPLIAGTLAAVALAGRAAADAPVAPPALADAPPIEPARPLRGKPRLAAVLGENLLLILPSTAYYWNTTDLQKEDWELDWDWPSWRTKLTTLDALILDTGNWTSNAIRHPLAGLASYQTGRAAGYGVLGSTAIDLATAVVWEYVVEYKERIALNDLVVNALSGFLIGEPLFQLGLGTGERAGWPRRVVAAAISPFDRLHAALGRPAWAPRAPARGRYELLLGVGGARHGAAGYAEVGLGLELEVVRGKGTAPGARSRATFDVRAGDDDLTRLRVSTATIYGGRFAERADDRGRTGATFLGAGGGFDLDMRRLGSEWDRLALWHLAGPRLELALAHAAWRVRWELGAYADVGMIQAHVFGPVPPWQPEPQTSVLRARGYYYGAGGTLATRIEIAGDRWRAAASATAHQLWSIDGYDRHELGGGPEDPHDVTDQRVTGRASIGVEPGGAGARLELEVEGAIRRGAWQGAERVTREHGVAVRYILAL